MRSVKKTLYMPWWKIIVIKRSNSRLFDCFDYLERTSPVVNVGDLILDALCRWCQSIR